MSRTATPPKYTAPRELLEYAVSAPAGSPLKVDRENGIIFGVKVLGRFSKNRYDLAAQHADMHDAGMLTPEDDAAFVDVMKSLGIEPLHEPGEVKPFDPETMEAPFGVSTGTPVKVIRRGWAGLYGDAGVGTELTGKNYRRAVVGRAD